MQSILRPVLSYLLLLAAVAVVSMQHTAFAAPTPAGSPSPAAAASPDNSAVLARAKDWYQMLQSGNIDRAQLTKQMNDALTDDKVKQIAARLKALGNPTSFKPIEKTVSTKDPTITVYKYHLDVTGGALVFTFALDAAGNVAGLFVGPA